MSAPERPSPEPPERWMRYISKSVHRWSRYCDEQGCIDEPATPSAADAAAVWAEQATKNEAARWEIERKLNAMRAKCFVLIQENGDAIRDGVGAWRAEKYEDVITALNEVLDARPDDSTGGGAPHEASWPREETGAAEPHGAGEVESPETLRARIAELEARIERVRARIGETKRRCDERRRDEGDSLMTTAIFEYALEFERTLDGEAT